MRRLALLLPFLALAAGCVVRAGPPVYAEPPPQPVYAPPPPAPPPEPVYAPAPAPVVWYGGPHWSPEEYGGGWCYIEGNHQHPYFPDQHQHYVVSNNVYYWAAPL